MHEFASFNQQILPANQININAVSSASLYGKGVFTTLAVYNSKPFLWDKHWRRLNDNARKLNIDLLNFNEQKVFESLKEIIEKNKVSNGRCRITFFDESASRIWQYESINLTSLLIQTADFRGTKQKVSLAVSPFLINSTSPLAGVKSCNYLDNILALENAKADGFDEAIRLNEKNEIVSACMANIFWFEYEKNELFTPALETGCLAGTFREFMFENYKVCEVKKDADSFFRDAEYVFLTSSGIRIVQVADCLEEFKFGSELHELIGFVEKKIDNFATK